MLKRTVPLQTQRRKDSKEPCFSDQLILGRDVNHFPIAAQRIANISKEGMQLAGIDTHRFKAHALQGASASSRLDRGESAEDVMAAGRWRSNAVFRRFYDRQLKRVQVSVEALRNLQV